MLAPAGARFKSKSVWQMLEKNYRTLCALHNTPVDPDLDMKEKIHTILVVGVRGRVKELPPPGARS